MQQSINSKWNRSESESLNRQRLLELFKNNPIPDEEILMNLSLFIKRKDLSEILFLNELYKKIVGVHGVIMEFGVRWGKNLAQLNALKGIYEPYNHNRKLIGFDTFSGFPSVDAKDGKSAIVKTGAWNVTHEYAKYLEEVLNCHAAENPISHIKSYKLCKGHAVDELDAYLQEHPETIIAFAYFDFDIYEPTKECLKRVMPLMPKGSIIGFDELNCYDYPGETVAFDEIAGLSKYRIERTNFSPTKSFIVLE